MLNARRALRGLLFSALLSALVYAVLAAVSDVRQIGAALRSFPAPALAAMIALTLANYLVRAARWSYLVSLADRGMTYRDAVYVQLSGTTMTVTPGKVGEVLKALLTRDVTGLPMGKGVALVFSERLADVVAVTALSTGAVGAFTNSRPALAIIAVVLGIGIAVLSSERVHRIALNAALRQRWMRNHRDAAASVSETIRTTLSPKPLTISAVLAGIAWSLEGIAFALCIRTLGFDELSIAGAVAIYAISTLVGALTFLPGGIGFTEASLAGLLLAAGMVSGEASAATLLIRLVTLWFGVALGWTVLASRPATLKRLVRDEDGEVAS